MINGYSDEDILQKIRLGIPSNSQVVGWLYDRIRPVIYSVALKYGIRNEEDIQDLSQDVIASFYEQVMNGHFLGRSSIRSYIHSITKNKCIDRLRKRFEIPFDPTIPENEADESDYDSPEVLILLAEKTETFAKYLSLFSTSCQELIQLQIEGFSNEEIAERLGKSSASYVATMIYRCKKSLAAKILNDPVLLGKFMDSFDDPFHLQKPLIKYVDHFDLIVAFCKEEVLGNNMAEKIQGWLEEDEELQKLIAFLKEQF